MLLRRFPQLRWPARAAQRLSVGAALLAGSVDAAETLRVQGSPVVAKVITGAIPVLRQEAEIEIKLATEANTTQAIMAVGAGIAEVAMATRALTGEDRAGFPDSRFHEVQIGSQAVVLAVPTDVWNSGVRAITKEQAVAVYQGKVKNWQQLGGEDRPIKFYNVPRGLGVWELFGTWLYGDLRRAPLGKFEIVTSLEDARTTVEFNAGSISLLTPRDVDGKSIFALGITLPDGSLVAATPEHFRSGKYPMIRPLYLIAGKRPLAGVKRLFEFMQTSRGQALVADAGFVPLEQTAVQQSAAE